MTRFSTPSRSSDHLSNYWNALVQNAPAEELARLARLVEPSEIMAIEQAYATHHRHEPDPVFARQLEEHLMQASSPIADPLSTPGLSSPPWERSRDSGPVSRRRTVVTPHPHTSLARAVALRVGLVIVVVLASLAGLWMMNTPDNDRLLLTAPEIPPASELRDHPIIGTWESPNGMPCWCLSVFTADGIAIGLDPKPADSSSGMSSQSIGMGIWYPTGERTAVGIVRIPVDNGGYIERTIAWEVSEDGQTATGSGSQRAIKPDGKIATMANSPPIEVVRVTKPEDLSVATPAD